MSTTTFEPLNEVRKNLKINWYRCPIDKDLLRELTGKSDLKGWMQAGGHLCLFVCTGLLTYYFFAQGWWIAFFLALFTHGTVGSFFPGLVTHELGHGTVFRTRWLNKFFLYIYAVLGWDNFYDYSFSHTYHHLYTLHLRGDREVVLPIYPHLKWYYLLQLFTINLQSQRYNPLGLWKHLKYQFKTAMGQYSSEWIESVYQGHETERKKAVRFVRLMWLFHLSVLAVAIYYQLWLLPVLLSLHVFIGNWLKVFVGAPMHIGLRSNVADFRKNTRSIKLDPISGFLYWHMNWHAEHHMYAGVPCYNLKKLREAIAHDMPEPKSAWGAWREMLAIYKKQKEDPTYEFDTPVPPPAERKTVKEDYKLAASIGEIDHAFEKDEP